MSSFRLSLACLLFVLGQHTKAQSLNLTITFSTTDQNDCANPSNETDTGGITFTTSDLPPVDENQCFNLDDLFTGINQGTNPDGIFDFRLSNQEAFDPTANYSRVYYQQDNPAPNSPGGFPDNTSVRLMNVYSGRDCTNAINDSAPVGQRVLRWYEYSCVSGGRCDQAAIAVRSFAVADIRTWTNTRADKTCRSFAYQGSSSRLGAGGGRAGVAVAALLMVLLV